MSNREQTEPNFGRLHQVISPPSEVSLQSTALPMELHDSMRWLEARVVRHVEEVVAGAEATQNLLRNELQQEVERVAGRQSVQLSKGEAAHMELSCRLDASEKRFKASQQDQLTEIVSLRSRLEATIGERLSCKLDDNEQRLRALQQEQRNEVSALRTRIDEATTLNKELHQHIAELRTQVGDCKKLVDEPMAQMHQQIAELRTQVGDCKKLVDEPMAQMHQQIAELQTQVGDCKKLVDEPMPQMHQQIAELRTQVGDCKKLVDEPMAQLHQHVAELRTQVGDCKKLVDEPMAQMHQQIAELRGDGKKLVDEPMAQMHQHIAELRTQVGDCKKLVDEPMAQMQQNIARLQDRLEQDSARFANDGTTMGNRLAALQNMVATMVLPAPESAVTDQQLTTLTSRVEVIDEKITQLSNSSVFAMASSTSVELSPEMVVRIDALEQAVASVPSDTSPRLSVADIDLLKRIAANAAAPCSELESHKGQATGNTVTTLNVELELLKGQMALACTNIDRVSKEVAEINRGTSVNHRQEEQTLQTIARCVGEMENELRVEMASRLTEAKATLTAEVQVDILDRTSAVEANVCASLGSAIQSALSELGHHVRKFQATHSDVKHFGSRLSSLETELRGTIRLVTSLANRALEERSPMGGPVSGTSTTSTNSPPIGGGFGAIENVLRGALHDSGVPRTEASSAQNAVAGLSTSIAIPAPSSSAIDGTMMSGSTTTESFTDAPLSVHDGSEGSTRSEHGGQRTHLSEGLLESLQGLAQAIDKTLCRPPTQSPEPSRSQSLPEGGRGGSCSVNHRGGPASIPESAPTMPPAALGTITGSLETADATPVNAIGVPQITPRLSASRGRSPVGTPISQMRSPRWSTVSGARSQQQTPTYGTRLQASRLLTASPPPPENKLGGSFSARPQLPNQNGKALQIRTVDATAGSAHASLTVRVGNAKVSPAG